MFTNLVKKGKKHLQRSCILAFCPLLFFSFNLYGSNDLQTIELAMRNNSPYNLGKPSEHIYNRVACSLNRMNFSLEINEYPWKRAQTLVRGNRVQGFFPGSTNSKREQDFIKSLPINEGYIYWVSLKGSEASPDIIENKMVGAIRGTNAYKWAKKQELQVTGVRNQKSLLGMLHSGRLEMILTSKESLNELNISGLKDHYLIKEAYKRTQYIFFAKEFIRMNTDFLLNFNKNLKKCILSF